MRAKFYGGPHDGEEMEVPSGSGTIDLSSGFSDADLVMVAVLGLYSCPGLRVCRYLNVGPRFKDGVGLHYKFRFSRYIQKS